MIFNGRASNGHFIPDSPSLLKQHLLDNEDKRISIETKRSYGRRTNPQNKYLWGVVYQKIAEELTKRMGEVVAVEDVHREMSEKYKSEKTELTNKNTGETDYFKVVKSSSQDTTVEFNDRCEFLRRWAATYLGIDIPEPQEPIYDPEGYKEIMK